MHTSLLQPSIAANSCKHSEAHCMTEAASFDNSKNNLPNETEHKQGQGKQPQNCGKQLQQQESSTTTTNNNNNKRNSHKSIHDNGAMATTNHNRKMKQLQQP